MIVNVWTVCLAIVLWWPLVQLDCILKQNCFGLIDKHVSHREKVEKVLFENLLRLAFRAVSTRVLKIIHICFGFVFNATRLA